MQTITSEYILPDIEHHFRVSAGPGAGKTHWLTEHIKNTLHNSVRLGRTRKVACITYTNIAVDTILRRLGTSAERAEVSTIHSFLYKHILKPYAFLIAKEYGLDVSTIDGHDDIILSNFGFLTEWKAKTNQHYLKTDKDIVKAFKAIRWKFDTTGKLEAKPDRPYAVDGKNIKTTAYMVYKEMAWEKAVIHHDDVLFFSYQIITKHSFVLEVIRAKFPYIFIDEFQDSSPIQVRIFEAIGQSESIIGIIGDKAQSIYKFQGANPEEFHTFKLKGIMDYVMEDNRRSTNEIIDMLNSIRTDITQNKQRNTSRELPFILIGDSKKALTFAKTHSGGEMVHSLSRDNITANAMKKEISGALNSKLFEELHEADKPGSGNKYRSSAISACLQAVEYAREGKFKDALKAMEKEFKYMADPHKRKSIALGHIMMLLEDYRNYSNGTLYDFFLIVKGKIKTDISNLAAGGTKKFYEGHTYQQMALCVHVPEAISQHKTIHKAKGDEYNNVMIIATQEDDLQFLISPALDAKEEHRIHYVAASRARERLFISVPSLSATNQTILGKRFTLKNV